MPVDGGVGRNMSELERMATRLLRVRSSAFTRMFSVGMAHKKIFI